MFELKNVIKKFDGLPILNNLCLNFYKNESIVIFGLSGAGKSVLLKCIAGLIPIDSGEIRNGAHGIGMCFQNNALFDSLTVEENLFFSADKKIKKGLGSATQKIIQEKVDKLLCQMHLKDSAHKYPKELSGGMQKRLAVARAIIINPDLLLMDEPTAGLDLVTSKSLAQLVRNFQKELQVPMITVTNDVSVGVRLADQIYLLHLGKLILAGTPEEFQNTDEPHLVQFRKGDILGPLSIKNKQTVIFEKK